MKPGLANPGFRLEPLPLLAGCQASMKPGLANPGFR